MTGKLNPDPELERLVQAAQRGRRGAGRRGRRRSDRCRRARSRAASWSRELGAAIRRLPLAALAPRHAEPCAAGDPLEALLAEAVRRGASDLLLVPGSPPAVRVDGRLVSLPATAVAAGAVEELLEPHLGARQRRALRDDGTVDFTLRLDSVGGARERHRRRRRLALPRQPPPPARRDGGGAARAAAAGADASRS